MADFNQSSDEDNDTTDKTSFIAQDQQNTLNDEIKKAKEQEACLIIIRGSPQGHRFFLTEPEMTVGRDATADISVSDNGISRKHAKLTKKDGKVFLTDLANCTTKDDNNFSEYQTLAQTLSI